MQNAQVNKNTYKQLSDITQYPGMSSLHEIKRVMSNPLEILNEFAESQQDIARYKKLLQNGVIVNSPQLIDDVLVKFGKAIEKPIEFRQSFSIIFGQGLFTNDGAEWRQHRKLIAPAFRFSELKQYGSSFVDSTLIKLKTWRKNETIDIVKETTEIAMNVAGSALFGVDTAASNTVQELSDAVDVAQHWLFKYNSSPIFMLQMTVASQIDKIANYIPEGKRSSLFKFANTLRLPVLLPGKASRAMKTAVTALYKHVDSLILERRQDKSPTKNLLNMLIKGHDAENGYSLNQQQIRDNILTLFIAGHETTALALAWSLWLNKKLINWQDRRPM